MGITTIIALGLALSAHAYDQTCEYLRPLTPHDPKACLVLNGDYDFVGSRNFLKIRTTVNGGTPEYVITNRAWIVDPQFTWPFTGNGQMAHEGFWGGVFATLTVCEPDGTNFLLIDDADSAYDKTWRRTKFSRNADGTLTYRECDPDYGNREEVLRPR